MNKEFELSGWFIVNEFFEKNEVESIVSCIQNSESSSQNFRKSNDLFAIRQFLKEIPEATPLIFTPKLKTFISQNFGKDYFVVKSIYFDKPEESNWFVAWHQDLTISVDQKAELESFGPWTIKHNQFAVQPPLQVLENIFTIRIHLDDTDEHNGALRVLEGSHTKGIQRVSKTAFNGDKVISCNVKKGGIMLMKPLTFHSSLRTTNQQQRRVVHLEFSNKQLPQPLQWAEEQAVL